MYSASEAIRLMQKSHNPTFTADETAVLANYKKHIDHSTKLHSSLGQSRRSHGPRPRHHGRLEAHRRHRRRKNRQGAPDLRAGRRAEITAMATIGAADGFGLPVSTTHVLSSGIAGTMAANHSGIQWSTVRNLALAWVLTLPVAMMLSGSLFWLFRKTF
jgi:inorganic phosphate transporter, PiT family